MRWSKLKKLVEGSFAESVRGRVHVYSTRYQCSCGRGWITVDGEELAELNTEISGRKYQAIYHETTKTECARHAAVPDERRTSGNVVEPGSSPDSICTRHVGSTFIRASTRRSRARIH